MSVLSDKEENALRTNKKLVSFGISISSGLIARLRGAAIAIQQSQSIMVEDALTRYLEDLEKKHGRFNAVEAKKIRKRQIPK